MINYFKTLAKFKQNGFTLLEIIIATTLLSFLMLGTYSLVDSGSLTMNRTVSEDRDFLQVETFFSRLEQDFAQIYSPLYYTSELSVRNLSPEKLPPDITKAQYNMAKKYRPSDNFPSISKIGIPIPAVLSEEKHELIFLSMANRRKLENSKESTFAWIRYNLIANRADDRNPEAPNIITRGIKSIDPYAPENDWEEIKNHPILYNVEKLEFHYWNPEREEYADRLRDLGNKSNVLRALKVVLIWRDSSNFEYKFERFFLPLWPQFDASIQDAPTEADLAGEEAADANTTTGTQSGDDGESTEEPDE